MLCFVATSDGSTASPGISPLPTYIAAPLTNNWHSVTIHSWPDS